jgi:hypothetical protein
LAWALVNAAYDEWNDFSLSSTSTDGLRGAAVELGRTLRHYHYHYDGDGCLDDD